MTILHISDTHGEHRSLQDLPHADVVVHSGDMTMNGSIEEIMDFLNWFCDLPYEHKIFIAGNHDTCLFGANIDGLDENCHYLCNSSVDILRKTFYGVPMFINDCSSGRQKKFYEQIPDEVNVLITHAPPYGILDCDANINYGSEELLKRVAIIEPQLHLFGHIHAANGVQSIGATKFSNAANRSICHFLAE